MKILEWMRNLVRVPGDLNRAWAGELTGPAIEPPLGAPLRITYIPEPGSLEELEVRAARCADPVLHREAWHRAEGRGDRCSEVPGRCPFEMVFVEATGEPELRIEVARVADEMEVLGEVGGAGCECRMIHGLSDGVAFGHDPGCPVPIEARERLSSSLPEAGREDSE